MPAGTNNVTDMFPVLPWTPEMRETYCRKRFGIEQRSSWVDTQFWGRGMLEASGSAVRLFLPTWRRSVLFPYFNLFYNNVIVTFGGGGSVTFGFPLAALEN